MNSIEQSPLLPVEYASMLSVAFVVTPTVTLRVGWKSFDEFVRLEKCCDATTKSVIQG